MWFHSRKLVAENMKSVWFLPGNKEHQELQSKLGTYLFKIFLNISGEKYDCCKTKKFHKFNTFYSNIIMMNGNECFIRTTMNRLFMTKCFKTVA